MKELTVRYLSLPDIEDGISSFYEHYQDKRCIEPNQPYLSGRCHTLGDELDKLAEKVEFMSRRKYAQERKRLKINSWKNAYGNELSFAVGKELESDGIVLSINGEKVLFRCPKGEFVAWPWKQNMKKKA